MRLIWTPEQVYEYSWCLNIDRLLLCVHTKNMGSNWNPCPPKVAVTLQPSLQWFSDSSHLLSFFFQPRWRILINQLRALPNIYTNRKQDWPHSLDSTTTTSETDWILADKLNCAELGSSVTEKPLPASVLAAIISNARAQWRYCFICIPTFLWR